MHYAGYPPTASVIPDRLTFTETFGWNLKQTQEILKDIEKILDKISLIRNLTRIFPAQIDLWDV